VRQLIEAIEEDLGGAAHLSQAARQLAQRAAVLGTFIVPCEAQWLGGGAVNLADYLAAINPQRRVLATIGLERRARDVTRRSWRISRENTPLGRPHRDDPRPPLSHVPSPTLGGCR